MKTSRNCDPTTIGRRLATIVVLLGLVAACRGRSTESTPGPADIAADRATAATQTPRANAAPEPDVGEPAPDPVKPAPEPDVGEPAPVAEESANPPAPAEAQVLSDEEAALVAGPVRAFTADLFTRLAARPGNVAFSPASIAIALGMTSAGARGETSEEMDRVLHLGDDPVRARELLGRLQRLLPRGDGATPVEIAVANRLFGERSYSFQREFLDLVATQFAAPLEEVDFRGAFEQVRGRINAWVSEQTRTRIPVILPEGALNELSRLVLVNAIYFKGKWALEFPARATTERPFKPAGGSQVPVPTMEVTGNFGYGLRAEAQVLELPYRGDELSMVVVLPPEGAAPQEWATAENLAALDRTPRREVRVRLPRFTIDPPQPRLLNDDLAALGMPRAFEASRAQFEGIGDPPDDNEKLYIFAVFHKAFVQVDEEGTEAAASTAVVMAARGGGPAAGPPLFWANRPFLFLLRENATGLILFAGRVDDPRTR